MSNQVFANMMEVSCKQASGKSICAFPDVCFTPPQTPATPPGVPIPYPNTGMASDTTDGSSSVKISGQEVMLKNKSYFKKSTGDEAGCAPKKGVVTSKNTGKVYFKSWSMDVKIEGENVVRHLDLTTHNHASEGPNSPPMAHFDEMSPSLQQACKEDGDKGKAACSGQSVDDCSDACKKAQACILVPKKDDKAVCCKPGNTGHHVVPAHCCKGLGTYDPDEAPCVCAAGWSWHRKDRSGIPDNEKTHPPLHEHQDVMERRVNAAFPVLQHQGKLKGLTAEKPWRYRSARSIGIAAHRKVFADAACDADCLKSQLDAYHDSVGIKEDTPVKGKDYGNRDAASTPTSVEGWNAKAKALGIG
jgi:hypothetical protein